AALSRAPAAHRARRPQSAGLSAADRKGARGGNLDQPPLRQALLRAQAPQRLRRDRDRAETRSIGERAHSVSVGGEPRDAARGRVPAPGDLLQVVQLLRHSGGAVSVSPPSTEADAAPSAALFAKLGRIVFRYRDALVP